MNVYVSHSGASDELYRHLSDALAARGVRLTSWRDAQGVVAGGITWVAESMRSAAAIVVLVDPTSFDSEWQNEEWSCAIEESWENPDKRLIPIVVDDAPVPAFLRQRQGRSVGSNPSQWPELASWLAKALVGKTSGAGRRRGPSRGERAAHRRRLDQLQRVQRDNVPGRAETEARVTSLQEALDRAMADGIPGARTREIALQLADLNKSLGNHREQVPPLRLALASLERDPESDPRAVARVEANLGSALLECGELADARVHLARALAHFESCDGPQSVALAMVQLQHARVLERLGDAKAAAAERARALATFSHRGLDVLGNVPVVGAILRALTKTAPAAGKGARRGGPRRKKKANAGDHSKDKTKSSKGPAAQSASNGKKAGAAKSKASKKPGDSKRGRPQSTAGSDKVSAGKKKGKVGPKKTSRARSSTRKVGSTTRKKATGKKKTAVRKRATTRKKT